MAGITRLAQNIVYTLIVCICFLYVPINAQTYTIGVEELSYMPFYSSKGGLYKGFGRDILDAFAHSKGYTFKYVAMPIPRLYRSLIHKSIDFKFPDSPYWGKSTKEHLTITYSEKVVDYIDGLLVKPGYRGKKLSAIRSIGTLIGFTPEAYQSRIASGSISLVENPSFNGLLKMALHNRIDGAYVNPEAAQYILKNELQLADSVLVFDESLPYTQGEFLLSTVHHKSVIKEFNEWLAANRGFIDSLYKKYGVSQIRPQ